MNAPIQPISPLRGLLEVTRLLRAQEELPELLDAIARAIGESLGYGTVAINLYRPEWDDFQVATIHGNEKAREALLGRVRAGSDWEVLLDERFLRRGAYFVPAGSIDWASLGASYIPDVEPSADPNAWDPEDALFMPLRHQDGHLLGIVSVDEPADGRRPTDERIDVLVALADHAALAVQGARETAEAERHKRALAELLAVSSQLTAQAAADEILRRVCRGIRDALGFQNVCAALVDEKGSVVPQASVGWTLDELGIVDELRLSDLEPLLDA
ncbi:MAG TPA: GAF domain-containing protein, partial [Gaiellaceae bacterium]|nr:GAF domain-containing protein [Gaiellaceae bacterium]